MSRFARNSRVFFFEEPIYEDQHDELRCSVCPKSGVRVMTPVLERSTDRAQAIEQQRSMLAEMFEAHGIQDFIAWYYTPMSLDFTNKTCPGLTVYDCMDELSAFAGAPAAMRRNEQLLFHKADLVFTGGRSLYESKRTQHASVHLFPSSVDVPHFAKALRAGEDPEDQRLIPHPRLGYVGVIDERMDIGLLAQLAKARPDWQIVMAGPVVKIDPALLPQEANIHYLGMKSYEELPRYLGGWDIAMLPFAQNEATRFISPTKTPEYLAAGLPVVSTPIRDVVDPYGKLGLVRIAENAAEWVSSVEKILNSGMKPGWGSEARLFLKAMSWDKTWIGMRTLMEEKLPVIPVISRASSLDASETARRLR